MNRVAAVDRAVLLNAPGELARVEEVELDAPGPGEVVVRMLAVGVCHSDLHVKETGGWGMPFPIALGHEGCGVVEALGEGVDAPAPGIWLLPTSRRSSRKTGRTSAMRYASPG